MKCGEIMFEADWIIFVFKGLLNSRKPIEVQPFGGISMLSARQFSEINGFSNIFWGWGGEDDDSFLRLRDKGNSQAHMIVGRIKNWKNNYIRYFRSF